MNEQKQDALERLWDLTVHALLERIETGAATSQDLNIARQMLKDHGVNVSDVDASPIGDLSSVLPFITPQTNDLDHLESYGQ
tara:strand:+ start:214 stop:459 length:246 start_codon:yes stop_codon:yes gene_type:complete